MLDHLLETGARRAPHRKGMAFAAFAAELILASEAGEPGRAATGAAHHPAAGFQSL
jgi:hypothetical protein